VRTGEPGSEPQASTLRSGGEGKSESIRQTATEDGHGGVFATTHWSVVLAAGQRDSPEATEALENLCRTYWYPLYAYIRRRGSGHEDAQDLTQGFLLQLLEHDAFNRVERSRGRFRSFLLASLNYYLADQRDHAGAIKRGAGQVHFSLDAPAAAEWYQLESPGNDSPERLFERRWALALLDQVRRGVRLQAVLDVVEKMGSPNRRVVMHWREPRQAL